MHINNWQNIVLPPTSSIKEVIEALSRGGIKIIIICSVSGKFEGTITDGDIRRGLLRGLMLADSCANVVNRNAIVANPLVRRDEILQIMSFNKIQQIPVVNNENQLIGLHLWDRLIEPIAKMNQIVIMAGGLGSRLRPYTDKCPKPLLPVAGKPILQHIIEQAKSRGFKKFVISINHLGQMIEEYFGDGEKFEVEIEYIKEQAPLGTGGALSLFNFQEDIPIIVTNGDVISDINFSELLDFHIAHNGVATMAVKSHEWQNPFGVVEINDLEIIDIQEKPVFKNYINAGVYVLNPQILNFLSKNQPCDMPNLLMKARLYEGARIYAYPMHEPWLDVGRPADLEAANRLTT